MLLGIIGNLNSVTANLHVLHEAVENYCRPLPPEMLQTSFGN